MQHDRLAEAVEGIAEHGSPGPWMVQFKRAWEMLHVIVLELEPPTPADKLKRLLKHQTWIGSDGRGGVLFKWRGEPVVAVRRERINMHGQAEFAVSVAPRVAPIVEDCMGPPSKTEIRM